MVKFIGKIILKTKSGNEVIFAVWYLKNAHKGYEEEFEIIHPDYWVIIKGGVFDSLTKGMPSGCLGEMLKIVKSLTNEGGKINYNDLPENVMDIANKEAIILNL